MSEDINYRDIIIPDPAEKPKPEWDYTERRAYILQRIEDKGHPRAIYQKGLAEEFDVSRQMIHKDVNRLSEYIARNTDSDEADAITDTVFRKAIREKVEEEEDLETAAELARDWQEWLMERGQLSRAPDKKEVKQETELQSGDGSLNITWDSVGDGEDDGGGDDG